MNKHCKIGEMIAKLHNWVYNNIDHLRGRTIDDKADNREQKRKPGN